MIAVCRQLRAFYAETVPFRQPFPELCVAAERLYGMQPHFVRRT